MFVVHVFFVRAQTRAFYTVVKFKVQTQLRSSPLVHRLFQSIAIGPVPDFSHTWQKYRPNSKLIRICAVA